MTKLIGVLSDHEKASKMSSGIFKQSHGLGLREKWHDFTEIPHFTAVILLRIINKLLMIFPRAPLTS
jgi:hypothetical protein